MNHSSFNAVVDSSNRFPRLPYDIRCLIWPAALVEVLHCIVGYGKLGNETFDKPVPLPSKRPLSPSSETTVTRRRIAAVCRDSRHVALVFFPDTLEFTHRFANPPGILRFNSANDVIFIGFYGDALVPHRLKDHGPAHELGSIQNLSFDLHGFRYNDSYLFLCFPSLRQLFPVAWNIHTKPFDAITPMCKEEDTDVRRHLSGSGTNPERYVPFHEHMCPSLGDQDAYNLKIARRREHGEPQSSEFLRHLEVKILLRRRGEKVVYVQWAYFRKAVVGLHNMHCFRHVIHMQQVITVNLNKSYST